MNGLHTAQIAVIGTRDQTALTRLAGVERYAVMSEDEGGFENKIRKAMKEFMDDSLIGIIMIPDRWVMHVSDIIQSIRRKKRVLPVIVEIPSHYESEIRNVKEYYKSYTRQRVGFNIEI